MLKVKDNDFVTPNEEKKILMHSCCAPCSGPLIEKMLNNNVEPTIFFYNPNIHPKSEYERRKDEIKNFVQSLNVNFVDADYDISNWLKSTKGLEHELEKGKRCDVCFSIRLNKTAWYAYNNEFHVITTSLSISRRKDMNQVFAAGINAASNYPGITYWAYNWRKHGGQDRIYEIAKEQNFYKQQYCGCIYSFRH